MAITELHGQPVAWPRPRGLLGVAGAIYDLAGSLKIRGHEVVLLDVFPDNPATFYQNRLDLLRRCDALLVYGYSTRSPEIDRAHNEQVIEWVRQHSQVPVLEFVYAWPARTEGFANVATAVFTEHEFLSAPEELRQEGVIVHLPHALRTDVFGSAAQRHEPDVLGYVGTVQEAFWLEPVNRQAGTEMGLPEPREIAMALSRHNPGLRWRFYGPTYGEDQLDRALRGFVDCRGDVPFAEIGQAYREFAVYLYTNAADSFGMTILEAQWCGTPVVCFDTPHYREIAGAGATFCRTVESFVEAVDRLEHPEVRMAAIRAGRLNAQRFHHSRVASMCEAHLNRLVAGRRNLHGWRSLLSRLGLPFA